MRIFGYRNLRMFFIPLFGAAVSGQNFNVAGWKKALVSLAGPVPGILIGTAMAIVALRVDQPWMEKAAMLAVVVNSINLLPFVPLDGGWFQRNPCSAGGLAGPTGFKVLAIAARADCGRRNHRGPTLDGPRHPDGDVDLANPGDSENLLNNCARAGSPLGPSINRPSPEKPRRSSSRQRLHDESTHRKTPRREVLDLFRTTQRPSARRPHHTVP